MGKTPDIPPPPDPQATIAAQSAANKEAIEAGARYGQINQVSPWGSLTYSGELGTPGRTQTTSLSPGLQQAFEGQTALQNALVNFANTQVPQVTNTLGQPLSFEGLTPVPASTDATRSRVEQSVFERGMNMLSPGFENEQRALEVSLANRGIPRGSEAWNEELRALGQRQGDARENLSLAAVERGGAEASRLLSDALRGRQQGISETMTLRAQPINELAAILGQTGGVTMPGFPTPGQGPVLPTNTAGIINQGYQNQLAGASLQNQYNQSALGGLFGLGSAGLLGFA